MIQAPQHKPEFVGVRESNHSTAVSHTLGEFMVVRNTFAH
ncbi:hypothetical protein BH20ACI3_BH20ACI3_02690 [soil metagenome]